jgi:SAM-dependent methyltransferase
MSLSRSITKAYHEDWKKKADDKGRLAFQTRAVDTLVNLFENILKKPFAGSMLDLGCGDGSMVAALNASGRVKAQGIDIAQGVDFESDSLPYADDTFDLLLMYSVIEHLHNPGNILSEVRRIVKKGGQVIIITPHFDLTNLWICCRNFYDDPTHVHPYSAKSLEHVMRVNRFAKSFLGLWTVKKPASLWRHSAKWQFFIGATLPFPGNHPWAPGFLKGNSRTMLGVFENGK